MNWLHYLLEANIYLGVFYLLYFLLLNKETYYKLNRAYLLCIPVLSYVIPLTQIGWLKEYEEGGQVVTVIYNPNLHQNAGATATYFTLQNILVYGYIAGAAVMLVVFAFKIFQLIKLTRAQKSLLNNKYKLVNVADTNTAFSFFNYLFIGTNVSGADTMIRHELVHIEQKHSVDIVFLELIKIINWFNPFMYLLQRSLKMVHEYIADEHTAAYEKDVLTYSSFLVSNAYGLSGSSISNSFFNYNLLKKRIIMLNQKRSGNLARLKYLLVVPLCIGLLCMSTLTFSKNYGLITLLPAKSVLTHKIAIVQANQLADRSIMLDDTAKKLKLKPPPPPPAPPKHKKASKKADKNPKLVEITIDEPTVAPSADTKELIADVPVKLKENPADKQKTPPPPPPMAPFKKPLNDFEGLSKYLAKYTRFPSLAVENKVTGNVVFKFTVDDEHKVSNIILLKGIGSRCDEEALRAFRSFKGEVAVTGTYKLAITFNIDGLEAPKPASSSLFNDPSFIGEIVISYYPSKK